MKILLSVLGCGFAMLTGCSPMNTDFSCKATATDSCLNIEDVDAMTRFADDPQFRAKRAHAMKDINRRYLPANDKGEPLWLPAGRYK